MPVIEVRGLRKTYGSTVAVDGISLDVHQGEVYALLGQNGAGKSTTVEILEGHRVPTAGEVRVLGHDPDAAGREYQDRIGIVLQTSGVETEFTVREVVDLYGSAYRRRRPTDEVIGLVGLDEKADARVGSLSGGQKRRVDLALGIVGSPEVLFLDEPTTGFDPAARRRSWGLIESLCAEGTTVLLTTHYLDEAEHLADRVGVLRAGELVAEGVPSELIEEVSGTKITFTLPAGIDTAAASADLTHLLGVAPVLAGHHVQVTVEQPTSAVHAVTGWAVDLGIELEQLSVSRASLEDVYLELTGDGAEMGDG